jgi:hypothetical protein
LAKSSWKDKAIEAVTPATYRGGGTAITLALVAMAVDNADTPHKALLETGIEASIGISVLYMMYGLVFGGSKTKTKKKK